MILSYHHLDRWMGECGEKKRKSDTITKDLLDQFVIGTGAYRLCVRCIPLSSHIAAATTIEG